MQTSQIRKHFSALVIVLLSSINLSHASGNSVSKIERPYIQLLENEIEYEFTLQSDDRIILDQQIKHSFSIGKSLSDHLSLELGVSGKDNDLDSLYIDEYEIELKWQLTEQGEFNNDWAVLFELEHEHEEDVWEFSTNLIVLHQWNRWVGTANIGIKYETSSKTDDEFETEFAGQLKYRYKQSLEPAIEYFKNQDTNAIGPSLLGKIKFNNRKSMYWGVGLLFSLDGSNADSTFRANVEFEF